MLSQTHADSLPLPVESPRTVLRVLHIVESLDRQAVESWLLRVLRTTACDYPHIRWTFFTTRTGKGEFDEIARGFGAEVIPAQFEIGEKIQFVRSLRGVMKRGRYDILHCHHDIMSAAYLLASIGIPFKKRIVHLYNTSMSLPTPSWVKSELAREPMRQICLRMADQIIGISKEALESLIGKSESESPRDRVVHLAVDTNRFSQAVNRAELRQRLRISPTARVLLFVGRMVSYKNPLFVVEILKHLAHRDSEVIAVLVGAGDQEDVVRETAKQEDLEERVRLLGFRDDVPELMLAADILLWPSLEEPMEGLGLGIIEAQAAGLPILMSRSVPAEAIVVPELVQVLPLTKGARNWASAVVEILKRSRPSRLESLAKVEASSFSMGSSVASLMSLYEGLENGRTARQ